MRKIFVALAAALMVTAGNAVSLRQFQARDPAALAAPQNNNQRQPAPRDGHFSGGEQPPRPRDQEEEKRPPRPPRREEGEAPEEAPSETEEEEHFEGLEEFSTFAQKNILAQT